MQVVALGTGAADGWPNPFCTCSSCAALRAEGLVRGQTAALVDGVLLLDCGPETPRAAARAGSALAGLRHLLLTHAHPDHVGPAALLWRSWAGRPEPLDLLGPPGALDACRDWIGPGDPVRLRPVAAGDVVQLPGYEIRVLPAAHGEDGSGAAVLYDVRSADGRLLYATDTGPLPEATVRACARAAYDLVLLEETFGDAADHGADHLDLTTFPRQLARLREAGAVTERTDVVAVHLGHRNPPTAELARRLAMWGARVVPDGTTLRAGPGERGVDAERTSLPARTLVLGGARSGKSLEAERRLAAEPAVLYLATGGTRQGDSEWQARVAAHRHRRPPGWRTVETTDVAAVLRDAEVPVLLDCLTLWLAAVMDEAGIWAGPGSPGSTGAAGAALAAVRARVAELLAAWQQVRVPVVAVSNEVGSGVVPATPSGRLFRDELGRLNAEVAAASEDVVLTVAGQALRLRATGR
jgi:adenosylcobinamide kinase / adenosylcobinamide-phosphate guanylyltransferase